MCATASARDEAGKTKPIYRNARKAAFRRDTATKGQNTMNETEKQKTATQSANDAEMRGSIIFLHRLYWGLDGHPKLHGLLTEMYDADAPPTAPAPVIEIRFRDARYYLLPEYIADFGLRLYSDYVQKRPPFTCEMIQKYYNAALNTQETQEMLAALLSGGVDWEDIPEADHQQNNSRPVDK